MKWTMVIVTVWWCVIAGASAAATTGTTTTTTPPVWQPVRLHHRTHDHNLLDGSPDLSNDHEKHSIVQRSHALFPVEELPKQRLDETPLGNTVESSWKEHAGNSTLVRVLNREREEDAWPAAPKERERGDPMDGCNGGDGTLCREPEDESGEIYTEEQEGEQNGTIGEKQLLTAQIDENRVTLTLFVALPPGQHSISHVVTLLVTTAWNISIPELVHLYVREDANDWHDKDPRIWTTILQQNGVGVPMTGDEEVPFLDNATDVSLPPMPPKNDGNRRRGSNAGGHKRQRVLRGLQSPPASPCGRTYDLYHVNTRTRRGLATNEKWWWQYDLTYKSYFAECDNELLWTPLRKRTPVLDHDALTALGHNMTICLHLLENRLVNSLQNAVEDGFILDVETDHVPRIHPPKAMPTAAPLDARQWDGQRILGAILLGVTLASIMILSQVSATLHRRRIAKHVWGNLASEEGVNELLKTGWVMRGSQMEIFDKAGVGYRDDDSILIGGYQERLWGVGTEVTVTQPESESRATSMQ